jgi:predicted ester cyclase
MSLEENKAIVRRLNEAFNKGNPDLLDDIVAPEYVDHTRQLKGVESLKQQMMLGRKAFHDYHETIDDMIAEGDKVWVRLTYTMTHTGEFLGVAPTGNEITSRAVDIHRLENGKIVEYWNVSDSLGFFEPLGVIEYTEKGKRFLATQAGLEFFPEDVK